MSAYLVVMLNEVKSTAWVENYVANVPSIFRKYGGEYIAVSKRIVREEGSGQDPQQIALFTFPSIEAIEGFLKSPEYKPYLDARVAATSADVFAIEG
ncbi:MAG: DUF1330 domain-containing protein [Steroidobacteraceae bacterium]